MSHRRCTRKGLKFPKNSCILGIETDRTTMVKAWASSWAGAFHSTFGNFSYACQVDLEKAADLRRLWQIPTLRPSKTRSSKRNIWEISETSSRRYLWVNVWRQKSFLQNRCVKASNPPRKVEVMGEHNCPRWHRDSYIGRGIISYNLSGTQYIAEVSCMHLGLEQ